MKYLIVSLLVFYTSFMYAQDISFGANVPFFLGNNAQFFMGGNTTFNGPLENNGTLLVNRDVDFVDNILVGNINFVGVGDKTVRGDSIVAQTFQVDNSGNVILETNKVIVQGALNVNQGVIVAMDEGDILVDGSSAADGTGYVEGLLVGLTSNTAVTFPMGIAGFPNYITFETNDPGKLIKVQCRQPDPATFFPDE
jgi:hypothetical protein